MKEDNVSPVSITITFVPGALNVKVECASNMDATVVFASALYKNAWLKSLVDASLAFLATPEFQAVIEEDGL